MDTQPTINERTIWNRGLYMLLFAALFWVARVVAYAVVILQFLCVLFNGAPNDRLLFFGSQISSYIQQIMRFLTFNTERRPYPLSEWPSAAHPEDVEDQSAG